MSRRREQTLGDEGRGPDIWLRLNRVLLVLMFLLVMAGILSLFWPEMERRKELESNLLQLTETRDALRERRQKLGARLEWLKTDPEYLETVARDRLDLQKDDELIIRIEHREDGSRVVEER
ncbi:MAG: septum formation initiator family protein [Verrucomicrobiales bacterium]